MYFPFLQSSAIIAGLGLAAVGFTGRYLLRRAPQMSQKFAEAMKSFPTAETFATSKYYRGGFEAKMNKREAALILGVSPTAPKTKVYIQLKYYYWHMFTFNWFFVDKRRA